MLKNNKKLKVKGKLDDKRVKHEVVTKGCE
jgi:hypothetical protein